VSAIAFSPDGRLFASGDSDKTVFLWDVVTHQPLSSTLQEHSALIYGLSFTPDSRILASSSNDKTIILWDVSLSSWQTRACRIANRDLTEAEWAQFVGTDLPYQRVCSNLPVGANTPPVSGAAAAASPAPTAMPEPTAAAGVEATATPGSLVGSSIVVPQGLRTDLQGVKIKAFLVSPGTSFNDPMVARFSEATGIEVQIIEGNWDTALEAYLQQLKSGSSEVDIYLFDIQWSKIMAEFAEDLNPAFPDVKNEFIPEIIANNTVNGRLVGVPWYADTGLLYYRTDLLRKYGYGNPPRTWTELEEMAKKIQDGERAAGNANFWGFLWHGRADEGLTCTALEWQASNGGGSIIELDGTISINNPNAIKAFKRAKNWVNTISPPDLLSQDLEGGLVTWKAGNAAFMRNWAYIYALSQAEDSPIKGKFDVTLLPKGDGPNARSAATFGGWQLMVSKFSKNKEAAIEFVKYLASPELQKANSIERSLLPTRPTVYDDVDVLKVNPYYTSMKGVFLGGAVVRPSTVSGNRYNDVSRIYFTNVHQILTGHKTAEMAVADIERELRQLLR
jgi:trehalose/maltose transport system substrate-binding protein